MTRDGQKGFSLVENLVALLVMSIGLLGIASLQLTGVSKSRSSFERSQATMLASEIVERMRANLPAAENGDYNVAKGAGVPTANSACIGISADCSPSDLAAADLFYWQRRVSETLKNTESQIQVNVTPNGSLTATLTLDWGSDQLQLFAELS